MPIGAITIESVRETVDGGQEILMSFAGDGTYPAGGTPDFNASVRQAIKLAHAAATDKNVRGEEQVSVMYVIPVTAGIYVPSYDYAADKLFVYSNATDLENVVANLAAIPFRLVAVCK